jgi:hypothetical protein
MDMEWICGLDLIGSGTSDEKYKCIGYDRPCHYVISLSHKTFLQITIFLHDWSMQSKLLHLSLYSKYILYSSEG